MDSDPAAAKQILCCQPTRRSMTENNQEAIYKKKGENIITKQPLQRKIKHKTVPILQANNYIIKIGWGWFISYLRMLNQLQLIPNQM